MHRTSRILPPLLLAASACTAFPHGASPPPTSPAPVASTTSSPYPTRAPSSTSAPTRRPSPTLRRLTLLPTMTPMPIEEVTQSEFILHPWTPLQASDMIAHVISALQALEGQPGYQHVYGEAQWMELHEAVAFAEAEALLRFPEAPDASSWAWDRCYYLALSTPGSEAADSPELQCYAPLLASALNTGETTPVGLPAWFAARESRIALSVAELQGPERGPSRWLIIFGPEASWPQAYALLSNGRDGFTMQPLVSYLLYLRMASGQSASQDLTGDGFPELILSFTGDYCCGFFTHHTVYSLVTLPARNLSFLLEGDRLDSLIHLDSGWISSLLPGDVSYPGLRYATTPHDPYSAPCNFSRLQPFHWDGAEFVADDVSYAADDLDQYDDMDFCREALSLLRDQADIALAANVLTYSRDDLRQEFLYRLGEDRARRGQVADATETFLYLLDAPHTSTSSQYSTAAQRFLDQYHSSQDYYSVCAAVPICDVRAAVTTFVAHLPTTEYYSVLEELGSIGAAIRAQGLLDFDADGLNDLWAVIHHPQRSSLEFWIFVPTPSQIHALYVADVDSLHPSIQLASGRGLRPVFSLADFSLFSIAWTNATPILLTASPPPQDSNPPWPCIPRYSSIVSQLSQDLLDGGAPTTILRQLLDLEEVLPPECTGHTPPPDYLYTLGLAAELAGDEPLAVETYAQLWIQRPESPFTVMARCKLGLMP